MKHLNIRLFTASLLALTALVAALPASADLRFAESSMLASGRWVKVAVDRSGIYQITYDELRSQGFANPANVAVYGRGGRMAEENFTDEDGRQIYIDDLKPVAVTHAADKLIFYADGVAEFDYGPMGEPERNVFSRKKRNRYSETGYYFITDSHSGSLKMTDAPVTENDTLPTDTLAAGLGFAYHERDITLGIKKTGNTFLGESFNRQSTCLRYEWDTTLTDAIIDSKALMIAPFYREALSGGTLSFGIDGAEGGYHKFRYSAKTPLVGLDGDEPVEVSVDSPKVKVFVGFEPDGFQRYSLNYCHLDYWMITYERGIPQLADEAQGLILFPGTLSGHTYRFKAASAAHKAMLLGADGPQLLRPDANGYFAFTAPADNAQVVVYNDAAPLLAPLHYAEAPNSDLHAAAKRGAKLLIVCKSDMLNVGHAIAQAHRDHDGMEVLVADIEQVYNEFSSGTPDVMAIRALAKVMYTYSATKLENILLVGVAEGDIKSGSEPGKPRSLIFPQHGLETAEPLGHNNIDFYANLDAYNSSAPERRKLHVGIGLLPCFTEAEGMNYVDKLTRYLAGDDAYLVAGNIANIGGVGNNNLHISQADEVARTMENNAPARFARASVCGSWMEAPSHTERFYKELGNTSFMFYSGHGAEEYIDFGSRLYESHNRHRLNNSHLGFMIFAGCNLTGCDRGRRGVSEQLVMNTRHGLIGCITSMRDTYANTNKYMVNHLAHAMSDGSLSQNSYHTPSIGQLYAKMKSQNSYQNELTYTLLGDPAVKLHMAVADIELTTPEQTPAAGEKISISGRVTGKDKEPLDRFNGRCVARLLLQRPPVMLPADEGTTGKDTLPYAYRPPYEVIAAKEATVVDGRLSMDMYLPAEAVAQADNQLYLAVSAYDNDLCVGAGGSKLLDVKAPEKAADEDTTPPAIESAEYLADSGELKVKVTDNIAVSFSTRPLSEGIAVKLDGEALNTFHGLRQHSQSESEMTAYIPLPELSDGVHHAVITARDDAGNRSSYSLEFTVGATCSPVLSIADAATHNPSGQAVSLSIADAGDAVADGMYALIVDSKGNEVARLPFAADSAVWALSDAGRRIAPGLYRAVAIGKDSNGRPWQSNRVFIPVL